MYCLGLDNQQTVRDLVRWLRVFVFTMYNTTICCVFNALLRATCDFSTFHHSYALVDYSKSLVVAPVAFVITQCRFLHHCAPSDKSIAHVSFYTDVAEHFYIFTLQPCELLLPLRPVFLPKLLTATMLLLRISCCWLIYVILLAATCLSFNPSHINSSFLTLFINTITIIGLLTKT